MTIHKTAIIDDGAQIDPSAEIGPYAVVGPNVKIGARTKVGAHCVIDGHTTIGSDCNIYAGASIGLDPQDLRYKGEPTGVIIGDRVVIREYVTIHRATAEGFTTIGDDCFFMNYVHIAHNCKVGRGVILANSVMMAGYVQIGDFTVMSGMNIFHQFVRVGRMVMVSGFVGARNDIPPFCMVDERHDRVRGINSIGMRRQGLSAKTRAAIKECYRLLYRSGLNNSQALARIEEEIEPCPEVQELVEFFKTSKRGVVGGSLTAEDEAPEAVPAEVI